MRVLLQLVYDTALKYNKQAGFPQMQADDPYQPAVNIAIGSQYIGDLKNQFSGMYEDIAASGRRRRQRRPLARPQQPEKRRHLHLGSQIRRNERLRFQSDE